MRIDGKYILGTASEIAKVLLTDVLKEKCINNKSSFYNCDFVIAKDIKNEDLAAIYHKSSGWYGIKSIDTGFDVDDLELFANYYGSSGGIYNCLYDGLDNSKCVEIVEKMIIDTLNIMENCSKTTMILGEIQIVEIKNKVRYYELCYFHGRKDTGSIYVKTELNIDNYIDEDSFLSALVNNNELDFLKVNSIVEINQIDADIYYDMTGNIL